MNTRIAITSYVIGAPAIRGVPVERTVELPPAPWNGRDGRLPSFGVALARRLTERRPPDPERRVFMGTALGSMTETAAFVEAMIRDHETSPLPRAFSGSVNNSAASRMAIALGARGDTRTFVHGCLSYAYVLLAASYALAQDGVGPIIGGAIDEWNEYVRLGEAAVGLVDDRTSPEGGALWLMESEDRATQAMARVRALDFGRPSRLEHWLATCERSAPAAVTLIGGDPGRSPSRRRWRTSTENQNLFQYGAWGRHGSVGAEAIAVAAGVVGGEVDPGAIGQAAAPDSIAVVTISRFGEAARVLLERVD